MSGRRYALNHLKEMNKSEMYFWIGDEEDLCRKKESELAIARELRKAGSFRLKLCSWCEQRNRQFLQFSGLEISSRNWIELSSYLLRARNFSTRNSWFA